MKQRPVLFSSLMVKALLEGRKTQTRRLIKPQPREHIGCEGVSEWWYSTNNKKFPTEETMIGADNNLLLSRCPYGQVGDILWVRETFTVIGGKDIRGEEGELLDRIPEYVYKGQKRPHIEKMYKWKPCIFMPKEACRIYLEITGIRVERLHDITENDAEAEGAPAVECGPVYCCKCGFADLWQSINGKESWNLNPWVWVISFKKIDKP